MQSTYFFSAKIRSKVGGAYYTWEQNFTLFFSGCDSGYLGSKTADIVCNAHCMGIYLESNILFTKHASFFIKFICFEYPLFPQ